jgi:protein TonB
MKAYYIALLAILFFSLSSLSSKAQNRSSKPSKSQQSRAEQGTTAADGRRIGKWNFYGINDELELTFDYDSSRISYRQADTTRYLVHMGEQWQLQHLTRTPHLIGSTKQRYIDIGTKLRYPINALRLGKQGTVVLAFTIDTDGHTKDYIIESSVSPECDQEVWRVVKDLPDNWIPAVYQGQLTATRFYLLVRFQLGTGINPISQSEEKRIAELTKSYLGNHYIQGVVVAGQISKQTYIR